MGKKQGVPGGFEDFHKTNKRKDAPTKPTPQPKRRRSDGDGADTSLAPKRIKKDLQVAPRFNGVAQKSTKRQLSKPKSTRPVVAKEPLLANSEDEDEDIEEDLSENSQLEGADEFDLKGDIGEEESLGDSDDELDPEAGSEASVSGSSDVVDSDAESERGVWSDEDEDTGALDSANLESMSRHLDAKAAKEAAEAQAELDEAAVQTNIAADAAPDISDEEDEEAGLKARLAPDLSLLRTRIADTIRVLDDFAKYSAKDPTRSRADYTRQLLKDICAYYGYSMFLAEKLLNLFPVREAFAFFEANETPRPIVIRTNTLRTSRRDLAQSLINRGVTLEPVGKWSKIGLQVFESNVPLGATPEYLAGQYIIQAASSFLPIMALAPQESERVLDMASAPGGKTTHMAAMMKNTGCIFANDSNKNRAKALIGNIHRLGVKNTIVCNHDALEFPKVIGGFDRVLLDAPCSGTGVIAKDASVKTNKTEKDFIRLPHLQKQLILAAIDSVDHASKTGGIIVYSTCSVTVEENEQVVQYALNKRPNVKLVDTGIVFGKEGFVNYMGKKFHPSMKMTRRYYPHAYNVDGFFVSKLQKMGPTPANAGAANTTGVPSTIGTAAGAEEAAVQATANGMLTPQSEGDEKEDPFAEFSDEGDEERIQRAERKSMRRKGINPKASKAFRKDPSKNVAPARSAKAE